MGGSDFKQPIEIHGIEPCRSTIEQGTFFHGAGGYVQLGKSFISCPYWSVTSHGNSYYKYNKPVILVVWKYNYNGFLVSVGHRFQSITRKRLNISQKNFLHILSQKP